jgi:tetratricopeptide (TPR) repeat protein
MDRARIGMRPWLCVLVALMVGWTAAPASADENADLRKQVLALNDLTGDDPILGQVEIFLADAANTKKLLAVAMTMAKEKPVPFNYNAALVLAATAADDKIDDVEASKTFYRVCAAEALKLKSGQKLAQSYGGMIDMLYARKKFDDSEKICKEFLEMEEDEGGQVRALKSAVLRRMIQAIAKQGRADEALKLTDNYVKQRKEHWRAFELKGWVLRELGKYEDSAKTYEDVLDRIAKDKNLEKKDRESFAEGCRYILSGIYVDMNQIEKAADHLKAILSEKPDNPTYNNDLGYIWADHDMNLPEAEKLIRKALDEDRKQRRKENPDIKPEDDQDNAAYLDSLGWVLFKQKKYKEAKEALLAATKDRKEGQHVEIYDHLGDVHMALGEKKEAVEAWKKGLEKVGTSKRELERKAKVEKKVKDAEK